MTDEQVAAAADRRYRRRQALITLGFAIGSAGQLANYFTGRGGTLGLVSGLGFGFCTVSSVLAWRRGMPNPRSKDQR